MNNKDEMSFLREKLTENITVPESLSAESIEKLISSEKQEKNGKGIIRRFAAVAVAACIMITSMVILSEKDFFIPESTVEPPAQETTENNAREFESYDGLIAKIRAYAKEYEENSKNQMYYFNATVTDDSVAVPESSINGSVTAGAVKGEYGETNLRDENVAEADIIVTDGEYLYCIMEYGKVFSIVEARPDGSLEVRYSAEEVSLFNEDGSEFKGSGDDIYYHELYIYENYLLVGFSEYTFENHRTKSGMSGFLIYDVTDKSAPVLVRKFAVDGNYISSRITDGKLILINSYSISRYFYGKDDSVLVPTVYNNGETAYVPCDCICIPENESPECYINVSILDLTKPDGEAKTSSFLGRASDTYCTSDTLYIMGANYSYHMNGAVFGAMIALNYKTTLSAVDISGEEAEYLCSAELDGTILNSFSIDEYNGYIRIALQKKDDNSILVLDKSLQKVSEITGIAKGEQIKSARFMGDTAYLVTFVQTDPLFVIDLSDPQKPEIKGEVKLPGFSSYLHPVGEGLLVGIGRGGTESGVDGSSKISLFDVSDPSSPKEIDSLTFPDSLLGTDYKAFCSVTENSFLVTYETWQTDKDRLYEDGNYRGYYIYTGAFYVAVENNKLVHKNSYLAKHIESADRTTFIGDRIYIFDSGFGGIACFDKTTEALLSAVTLNPDTPKFTALA